MAAGNGFQVAARTLTSEGTMQQLGGGGWGGFGGAKMGRLTNDWPTASRSIDQDLVTDLRRLRARARNQAINSPIASKFLGMLRTNVVGEHGVRLAFKVKQLRKSRASRLNLDDAVNDELAQAWHEWGKKGSCTVCGRYSLRELEQLIVENTGRDGEQILKKVYVPKSVNPFGFQLQLIDADQLDDSYNVFDMGNGRQIRMGVEVNDQQRPLAFHIFSGNPFEGFFGSAARVRVPADQIIHWFIAHRTGQTRGYPWFASSMDQLNMLDGYFKAELAAARIASMAVYSVETDPNAPEDEFAGDGDNADGTKAVDIGNGTALEMPQGQHLAEHTPAHPTNAFEGFMKQSGRAIASGCGVAYHKLCSDLSGVNYSSGRLGELEERQFWMEMQNSMIDNVLEPIYDAWLGAALINGAIDLPLADRKRFTGTALKWHPRRWPWVDPLKDVQASTLEVQNAFSSHQRELGALGLDWREVFEEMKEAQDYADELGLAIGTDIRGQGTSEINNEDETAEGGDGGESKPAAEETPANGKPAKPKAKPRPAPAKPKVKTPTRELVRGMHPANASLLEGIEDDAE